MSKRQLGGLQKQALHLYREILRVARTKPDDGGSKGRTGMVSVARAQFEQHRNLERKDFIRIEHLLRVGRRQLDMLRNSDVTNVQIRQPFPSSVS